GVPLPSDSLPARFQELFPGGELHAGPFPRLAGLPLGRVDRPPALVFDVVDALLVEEALERPGAGAGELAGAGVLEQQLDRLGGVLLVRADHAARAALDPAGGVRAICAENPPPGVRDRAAALVERHAGERNAAVADAPEHEPAGDRLGLARGAGDDPAVFLDELVPHHLDRLHAVLAENRHRRDEEAQQDAPRLAFWLTRCVLLEQLEVPAGTLTVRLELGDARRIELE